MLVALLVIAVGALCWAAYDRSTWRWRASVAVEQNVRLQRKVALLEHDLMRAEDTDRLWSQAKQNDSRAERALIVRLQKELDGWGADDERPGSR